MDYFGVFIYTEYGVLYVVLPMCLFCGNPVFSYICHGVGFGIRTYRTVPNSDELTSPHIGYQYYPSGPTFF